MLAEQAYRALTENEYGQYDGLIEVLAPTLGPAGLDHLKQLILKLSQEPVPKPRAEDRKVIGWGSSGPFYADDLAERHRSNVVRLALEAIADAQGDVDAFIAQQSREGPGRSECCCGDRATAPGCWPHGGGLGCHQCR